MRSILAEPPTMSPSTGPVFRADPNSTVDSVQLGALAAEMLDPEQEVGLWLGRQQTTAPMPQVLADAMRLVTTQLAAGHAVTILPHASHLTSSQAASLLGVSRPHLIKLLSEDRMPCEWVGSHRRIPLEAVMAYRDVRSREVREGITDLLDSTRAAGLDDDDMSSSVDSSSVEAG